MKRLISFILILLLLTPAAFAAEDKMVFRLESASGNVGDTVTVDGLVVNAPVCASFRVILTYDNTVLEPVSATKQECSGLYMSNVNYKYKDKAAINVLAADANKSLEGNMKLFTITFKIIGESPENNGSPLNVVHQEFFDPSTPKPQQVYPVIETGRIYVGDDQPGDSSSGDSSTGENDSSTGGNDTITGGNDTTTGGNDTTTGGNDTTTGGNDTTTGGSTTGGNDTTTGGNDSSTGGNTTGGNDSTTGDNTTGGNDNTAGGNTTGGNDSTTGGNTTGGNDNTAGGNTTGGNDSTTGGNTTGGNDSTTGDNTTGGNDTSTGTTPEGDTPISGGSVNDGESTPEGTTQPEEDTKKPTGSWIADPETEDIYHVDESGNTTVFEPEYTEKPEPGKVTDVVLKDKETGKEAGSIKVEGKEDGSFDVIEQDVPSLEKNEPTTGDTSGNTSGNTEKEPKGVSVWVWVGIGGGVALVAAAAAAWYFLIWNKKTED